MLSDLPVDKQDWRHKSIQDYVLVIVGNQKGWGVVDGWHVLSMSHPG